MDAVLQKSAVQGSEPSFLRGLLGVVGGIVLLLAACAWLGNLYFAPIKMNAHESYGGQLPANVKLLNAIRTPKLEIVEYGVGTEPLKVAVVIARTGALTAIPANLTEAARVYQVDKQVSPGFPALFSKYMAAQYDAWRAGEKSVRETTLFNIPVRFDSCRGKEDLHYAATVLQHPVGPVLIFAQHKERAVDIDTVVNFVSQIPRLQRMTP